MIRSLRRWITTAAALYRQDLRRAAARPLANLVAMLAPVNFLILFALFALGGGTSPAAVVNLQGPSGQAMVQAIRTAHTFRVHPVSAGEASRLLQHQDVLSTLTIPPGFTAAAKGTQGAGLWVHVNNVNSDFADDVIRGAHLAVFQYLQQHFPTSLRVVPATRLQYPRTTGFLAYIAVSVLSVAMLIAGLLIGGQMSASEWETATIKELLLAPAAASALLLGRIAAAFSMALLSSTVVSGIVVALLGVHPLNPVLFLGVLAVSVAVFAAIGVTLGLLVKSRRALFPLTFALGVPLFLISGAFDPVTWGSHVAAMVAYLFPVVYANALLHLAAFGPWILPMPIPEAWAILGTWAVGSLLAGVAVWKRTTVPH